LTYTTTWGPTKTTSFKKKVNAMGWTGIPYIGTQVEKEWYVECYVDQRFGEEKTIEIIT